MFAQFRSVIARPRQLGQTIVTLSSTVVLTGALVTGAIALVRQLGGLEAIELDAYDWLLKTRPDEGPDDRLLVVGINEADLQQRQEYPIHDGTLAEVLAILQTYQPRAIALDIARDVPQGEGRPALLKELQGSDRIVVGCKLSSETEPGVPPPPGVAPDQVGFTDLPQDAQGIIRRTILVSTPAATDNILASPHLCNEANPDNELLSLSLLLALIYLEDEGVPIQQTEAGDLQLGLATLPRLRVSAGGYRNNGAVDYQLMLNYRSAEAAVPMVSLIDVLEGRVEPASVENRLVLIGYTSTIANDHFFTPYSRAREGSLSMPGVVVHAQSTSQLISAALDGRSLIGYWPTAVELLWILAWALAGGTIGFYVRRIWLFMLAEAIVVSLLFTACYALFLGGVWVPLPPALLAILMTAGGTVLLDRANRGGYSQALFEQTKQAIQGTFSFSIEVDQAKKAQQVTEITNSSFFQDLQQRAKDIRERRDQQLQETQEIQETQPKSR